ncbi:MAG: ABC transporter ATP-binding protein [Treponema sp.]|nr:MAG: ABC transporter ATP-binding protein [Treponema sp.]
MANEKKKRQSTLKRLLPYMGNKKYLFSVSLVLSAISAVLGILPFVFLWFIAKELFVSSGAVSFDSVKFYAFMALGSAVLGTLVYFFALLSSHFAAFHAEMGIRKVGMQRVMNMPLGFFSKNQSGKLRKAIDDNAAQTHTFLAHQLPDLAGTVLAPIIMLALLFIFDWRLGLVSMIPIVLGLMSMSLMMTDEGKKLRLEFFRRLEKVSSESVEYVRGIPVVKTFGQSVFAFKRFVDSIKSYKEMVIAVTLIWKKPMSFYTVIMQAAAFFLVPFSILFITLDGNIAEVLTDFTFYLLIAPNFTMLLMKSMYFQSFAELAAQALNRFDDILDYPEMVFEKESVGVNENTIEFKDVVFAYADAKQNAVDGVSFDVKEGESVALVGASGGGKTTIARLATRFWDADSGEVLIGGKNIKSFAKQDLMDRISFVFQNTKLFKTSLRENIIYGNENAGEAEIQKAVDLSQSREIIDGLPEGLETVIGKEGTYLSGGEQQRIALARAILKDAPIVILDEATAFADPENEHLIQAALHELSKNKTTLMIAHRLTTVKNADKILVVDNGKIVQSGTHDELLKEDGLYTTMWNEYQQSVDWKI